MKRRISSISIVLMGLLAIGILILPSSVQADASPKVLIDGQELKSDVPGIIHEGRTLVPFRAILEALNASVSWDEQERKVYAVKGQTEIILQIDNKIAWVNARTVALDVPATIFEGRTMVPVRFVAESLGETVNWDSERRIVSIETNKEQLSPQQPIETPQEKNNEYTSGSILQENKAFEYSPGNSAMFLKGTQIDFYPNGKVKAGTLAEDTLLKYNDSTSIVFKKEKQVEFSEQGWVKKATLLNDSRLPYLLSRPNASLPFNNTDGMSATFKAGTEITFDKGRVTCGTLLNDTTLRYQYGALTEFLGGTEVKFNENGLVVEGVLSQPARLQFIDHKLTDKDAYAEFKERTSILFHDNGYVASGTLRFNTELQYYKDRWAVFAKNTVVKFNEKGYVRAGVLGEYAKLEQANNQEHGFAEGSEVVFNDQGYVVSGVLGSDLNMQGGIFRSDRPIEFWDNGNIKTATLRYDSYLSYNDRDTAQFKMDTVVNFHENGRVAKGTLKYHEDLPYTKRLYSNKVTFQADTTVEFDEQGLVIKGYLFKDAVLEYASKKSTAFKAGEISFANGYVSKGTLQHPTELENVNGAIVSYPAHGTVTFNEQGQVISVVGP